MKFTCTRENLMHALDIVGGIAGKHNNLPILENLRIVVENATVEFAATNLELAVRVPLRAKVESPGSFTVPAKTLAEYVRLLSDEQVTLELQGSELAVSSLASSTKIKGAPADEYPVLPEAEDGASYSLLVDPFRDALSKVAVAVSRNEIRPELSGVYVGFFTDRYNGLVLAATDSYRLAEKKMSVGQGSGETRAIVPGKTVYEVVRLLGVATAEDGERQVRVTISENQFVLRYGAFELTSRMVEGTYPDYAQIIPESFQTSAILPSDLLVKKIKAASLFTTTGVNAVSFDFNVAEGSLGVSSTSTQKGEHSSAIDVAVTGEENSILLNHKYVLDGLSQVGPGEVEFAMNGSDAPCLFRTAKSEDYVYIVMPIRQ